MNELGLAGVCCLTLVLATASQSAGVVTDLFSRGYCVMPTPQQTKLQAADVVVDAAWQVRLDGVDANLPAVRSLVTGLRDECGLDLKVGAGGDRAIVLAVKPGAVKTDTDAEREKQGYMLAVTDAAVEITGNAEPGLFYGVQTLLQLLRPAGEGKYQLPVCEIRDWPTYQLRILHWDTKHHQDRIEVLKRYLDQSARFKLNAIAFELEDKFEYPSHPIIGAPGAFTTEQMQDLTRYALDRYIQIIPNVQAPAHMGFVLKHEQFAHLRSDGSNYQSRMWDPEVLKLIFEMYSDVIEATPGVDYLFVSTDEVYYAGIDPNAPRPYNPVNRSLTWVEFVQKAHEFLSTKGRRPLVWAEFPLLAEHVHMLPPDTIDGIMGGDDAFIEAENKRGIRQLAYVSMQGAEKVFPNYFAYQNRDQFDAGRLASAYDGTLRGKASKGNPIGTFSAAWDDAGLHNETFWLSWAVMGDYGWTPGTPDIAEAVAKFMYIYHGREARGMVEVYRALQEGARFWEDSWRRVRSTVRGPGYGSSRGKGIGTQRYDMTLPTPGVPTLPDLEVTRSFRPRCKAALAEAPEQLRKNDQLVHLLQENLARAKHNRYSLEVFLSLAYFQRHFIELLMGLDQAEGHLLQAKAAASSGRHGEAIGQLVRAHEIVVRLVEDLDRRYHALKRVFEKSRYPKGRSVDGREFVHIMDDVKDHFADRRADLSFMIAPEQSLDLPTWCKDLQKVINEYAQAHDVAVRPLPEPVLED